MRKLLLLIILAGLHTSVHAQQGAGSTADSLPPPPPMTLGYSITEIPGWKKTDTVINGMYITVMISPEDSVGDRFRENMNLILEPCGDITPEQYFEAAEVQLNKLPNFQLYRVTDTTINKLAFKKVEYTIENEKLAADITTYLLVHDEVAYIFTCSTLKGDRQRWKSAYEKMLASFKID